MDEQVDDVSKSQEENMAGKVRLAGTQTVGRLHVQAAIYKQSPGSSIWPTGLLAHTTNANTLSSLRPCLPLTLWS